MPHLICSEEIRQKGVQKFEAGEVTEEQLLRGLLYRREIEQNTLPAVSLRACGEKVGWGLFAEKDLGKEAFVGEYTGIVRKNDEHGTINNYLYGYPVLDDIGRQYVVDAKVEGNLLRFINHSKTPNLKPLYAFLDGFYHVILLTIQPIKKGDQLSYDYGDLYWYVRSPPENL